MSIKYPDNISDFLSGLISFSETVCAHHEVNESTSRFTKALVDFRYIRRLFEEINEPGNKDKFKEHFLDILLNKYSAVERQLIGYCPIEIKEELLKEQEGLEKILTEFKSMYNDNIFTL